MPGRWNFCILLVLGKVLVSDAAVSPALFVIVFAFGCALEALECHHLSQNN